MSINVPIVIPDIRIDYNQSNQEFTAVDITDGSVLFKFIKNAILGIDFFGSFSGSITFLDFLKLDGFLISGASSHVSIRSLKNEVLGSLIIQDPNFGIFTTPYNITGVFINGLNILANPVLISSTDPYVATLIDSEINTPENSSIYCSSESSDATLLFIFSA